MSSNAFGLPREVGDGLILRWAQPEDIKEIAEFNFEQHNGDPEGVPEVWLRDWTLSLGGGEHPLTGPDDFTVVVDQSDGGKIISSAVLISQSWSYDGIEFGCGQPELIATERAYRKRGLVREQMAVLHAKSESRGDLVQAITGIPWYYRQFGYEMAINLSGKRVLPWEKTAALQEGQAEKFSMRQAREDDIQNLLSLYGKNCSTSLVKCQRDERIIRYELKRSSSFGFAARNRTIVETAEGEIAGYFEYITFPKGIRIRELAVMDGASLREICWFVVRKLKEWHSSQVNKDQGISFALGVSHPVYDALEPELEKLVKPYAWYIRVPDLTRWLLHIRPLLDERLSNSVMAGFEGHLKLNFYNDQLKLSFIGGKLTGIQPYEPDDYFEGDAFFPDLTFTQLLFGYRTIEELNYARADCFWEKAEAAVLLPILFPQRPSNIIMVG